MDLTSFIVHPATVWLLAGALVTITGLAARRWHAITSAATAQLRTATQVLERVPGQTAFAQIHNELLGDVGSHFRSVPSWQRAWERFQQALAPIERGDGAHVLAVEHSPSDFFHSGVLYRDHAMYWLRGLPNYLVGLGLCFTFLGIIAVIMRAAGSLGSATDAGLQTLALRQLLEAASLKFSTSLVGVSCSIGYSVYFRARCAEVERSLDDFCSVLGRRVLILHPATLLQINLQHTRRQTGVLGNLASNIAIGVGEKLADASEVQVRALARLEAKIETKLDSVVKQSEKSSGALVSSIHDLKERVCQINDETMSRLVAATLESLDAALQGSFQNIGKSFYGIGEELERVHRSFEEINSEVVDIKGGYNELSNEIRTRAEEVSEILLSAEAQVDAHLQKAESAAECIGSMFTSVFSESDAIRQLFKSLSDTSNELRNTTGHWSALAQDLSHLTKQVGIAAEGTQTAAEALQRNWEGQANRIAEIDVHLAATIGAVQTHFDGYALRLRNYTSELDGGMARAIERFGASIQGLDEAPERLNAAARQMHQVTLAASDALEPFQELKSLAAAMSESAKALSGALRILDAVPAPLEMPPRP